MPPLVFPHDFPAYVLEYFPHQFRRFKPTLPHAFEFYLGLSSWTDVENYLQMEPLVLWETMDMDFFVEQQPLLLELHVMLDWMLTCRTQKQREWFYANYVAHHCRVIWTVGHGLSSVLPEKGGKDKTLSLCSTPTPSTASSTTGSYKQVLLKSPPPYSQVSTIVQEVLLHQRWIKNH